MEARRQSVAVTTVPAAGRPHQEEAPALRHRVLRGRPPQPPSLTHRRGRPRRWKRKCCPASSMGRRTRPPRSYSAREGGGVPPARRPQQSFINDEVTEFGVDVPFSISLHLSLPLSFSPFPFHQVFLFISPPFSTQLALPPPRHGQRWQPLHLHSIPKTSRPTIRFLRYDKRHG